MIRGFLLDFVLPFLVFLVLRKFLRGFFSNSRTAIRTRPYPGQPPPPPPGGPIAELKKDPVCGAYVSTATSPSRNIKGQLIYFCSPECRDKYVA
jgi:YHS domain-containing protein